MRNLIVFIFGVNSVELPIACGITFSDAIAISTVNLSSRGEMANIKKAKELFMYPTFHAKEPGNPESNLIRETF